MSFSELDSALVGEPISLRFIRLRDNDYVKSTFQGYPLVNCVDYNGVVVPEGT